MIDQGLLHRMQLAAVAQTLDSDQLLAVERRQKLDAGVHGAHLDIVAIAIEFGQHDGACTAIAFGTAFFGSGAAQIFAQVLQHGSRRVDVA